MIHYQIAQGILVVAKDKASEVGIDLDIGEFPKGLSAAAGENADPERPVKLVAHIVARMGDRIPVFRKWSRHAEGQDKRSGMLSDIFAASVALYERNPEVMADLYTKLRDDVIVRRQSKKVKEATATSNGNGAVHNTGVI